MTYRHVAVLVEGQTEARFVREVLQGYVSASRPTESVWLSPTVVVTSTTPEGRRYKGGGGTWRHYARDLSTLLGQTHWHRVALLVDYYAYPSDAPGADVSAQDCRRRHASILAALEATYDDPRFIPGVMLHEFETWVIAAAVDRPAVLGDADVARRLRAVAAEVGNDVELVDDGPATAPSKRVAECWTGYSKPLDGINAVQEAGLEHIRSRCPALRTWLDRLTSV